MTPGQADMPWTCYQTIDSGSVLVHSEHPMTSASVADLIEYLTIYKAVLDKRAAIRAVSLSTDKPETTTKEALEALQRAAMKRLEKL